MLGIGMPQLPWIVLSVAVIGAVLIHVLRRKKEPVKQISHEYFGRVWLWPQGSHTRWEAELDSATPGTSKVVGFHSETLHEEVAELNPTEEEVAFCKARMSDLDGLFELARPAIEEAWKTWVKDEMPSDWRAVLALEGLSVPKGGDTLQPWGITYFCEPARHYFSIDVREGKASLASVDG